MSRDHHHIEETLEEEPEKIEKFPLKIFEGFSLQIPPGFNSVTIDIDARMQGELIWNDARKEAEEAIEKGFSLMWSLDLGLFNSLPLPLSNQSQFLSLAIGLEHFRDTLWKDFKSHTIGAILFKGSANFSHYFQWSIDYQDQFHSWLKDQKIEIFEPKIIPHLRSLFYRDVALEYFSLLSSRLPDTLPLYLYLDAHLISQEPITEMQLLNLESFERWRLALRGSKLPFKAIGWGQPTPYGYSGFSSPAIPMAEEAKIGICVPAKQVILIEHYQGMDTIIKHLIEKNIPFKMIAEAHITAEWDGLDYMIFSPNGLSVQGKRKLQGFCAAGGTAVSTCQLIGLSNEIDLETFLSN